MSELLSRYGPGQREVRRLQRQNERIERRRECRVPEFRSEFGKGLVVCLAKFSEHLMNWSDPTRQRDERRLEWELDFQKKYHPELSPEEQMARAYSQQVEMWANGASDHMYEVDESAPEALKQLADLTLTMGHGFTGRVWTPEDMRRVRMLWKESCLALDRRLGVETDWGEW